MLRVWLVTKFKTRRREEGFLSLEVLLAAVIFGFLSVAVIGAIVYGRQSTAGAGEYDRASALADEGIEAVRNIRDAAYVNLTNGTYGLVQSGSVWTLSGSSDATGIFTRQIVISQVDSSRKSVVSTVSWTTGGVTRQVSATARLTNWLASIIPPVTSGPIMMAYSKTTTTPFYRIWGGTTWGAEGSANVVVGNINYVVLKSARTRNEAILGTQTSTGAIYVQIWNGTSWGAATQVGIGSTTMRSFDIDYEKNGDRAIITYTATASSVDFDYRIWNGSTLSAATTVTAPPTTGTINWVETAQNPGSSSNEIAMMMLDSTTAVYGMVWNGTGWSNMGVATTWDTTTATASKKVIDVAYEQTSGHAMFVWGDSLATTQAYRIWGGSTLGSVTTLAVAASGGVAAWVKLASRPNSNEIMYGVLDAGIDLNTRKWSGTAWDTATEHPEHTANAENTTSMVFDIAWETYPSNSGKAWLMWGDGATVTKKQWSGTAWGAGSVLTGSDDTSFIRLKADPVSGAVFAGIYEDSTSATDDIWESRLTGGSSTWTAKNSIWTGPTGASPVFFRVDIATP